MVHIGNNCYRRFFWGWKLIVTDPRPTLRSHRAIALTRSASPLNR